MSQADCVNLKKLYEKYRAAAESFRLMKTGQDEKQILLAQRKEVVASRKMLLDALQKVLPPFSLKKLHTEFGYDDIVFYTRVDHPDGIDPREFRFDAAIYQTIIWELASEFAGGRLEMSNAVFKWLEKMEDMDKPVTLLFVINFFEKEVVQFEEFLKKHLNIIPSELLHGFHLVIGNNLGTKGGIEIADGKISIISQDKVDQSYVANELGNIGRPKLPAASDKFDKIEVRLVRKIRERLHHP
jgi:hypothetical protein